MDGSDGESVEDAIARMLNGSPPARAPEQLAGNLSSGGQAGPEQSAGLGGLLGIPVVGPPPELPPGLSDLASGHTRVDPDGARRLVEGLEAIGAEVGTLQLDAEALYSGTPGAADLVSLAAAGAMCAWPDGGGMLAALQAYELRIQESSTAYRLGLDAVLQAEEQHVTDFRAVDGQP